MSHTWSRPCTRRSNRTPAPSARSVATRSGFFFMRSTNSPAAGASTVGALNAKKVRPAKALLPVRVLTQIPAASHRAVSPNTESNWPIRYRRPLRSRSRASNGQPRTRHGGTLMRASARGVAALAAVTAIRQCVQHRRDAMQDCAIRALVLCTEDAPALDGASQLDVLQVGHGVYLLLVRDVLCRG